MLRPRLSRLLNVVSIALIVLSPIVLYVAVTRHQLDLGAILLLVFAVVRALPAFLATSREHRLAALRLPLVAIVSAVVGVLTREPRALLVLPSGSQLALALVFLASLRKTPLVEHFARMESPKLGPRQRAYCRVVTLVWGVVLTLSALFGLALAFYGSTQAWAAFTTVGVYIVIAVVFGTEYTVRRILFRDYTRMPVDRLLAAVFPGSTSSLDLPEDVSADAGADATKAEKRSVTIPPTYIFFRGHFDAYPILPGIVELTEILLPLARRRFPQLGALVGLRRVRFRRPIRPGDEVEVKDLQMSGDGSIRFELRVRDHLVSNGVMVFAVEHE